MKLPRFRSKRSEQDLDAEVRAYMDALVDEKMRAGVTPEEAKRHARIEAGGIEQVKEEDAGRARAHSSLRSCRTFDTALACRDAVRDTRRRSFSRWLWGLGRTRRCLV